MKPEGEANAWGSGGSRHERRGDEMMRRAEDRKRLPAGGFVERTRRIREGRRQLARGKVGCSYALVERCCASENLTVHLLWVDHADGLGKVVAYHFDRRFQVGVARNEYGAVVFVPEGVKEHVRGDVDVRTFLFRLYDADERARGVGIGNTHHDRMRKIAAKDALCTKCFEGAKIYFLTERLTWVVWTREDTRREVFYSDDLVLGREDLSRHGEDVKPSVWCSLERSVVEVESVNVNYSSHQFLSESESRPFRNGPAPVRRSYSGVRWWKFYQISLRGARGSRGVPLWECGIVRLWDCGIMRLWNYGIVGVGKCGIMKLRRLVILIIPQWYFPTIPQFHNLTISFRSNGLVFAREIVGRHPFDDCDFGLENE